MKARLFVISFLAAGLVLLLVWAVAAQGTETRVYIQSSPYTVLITEDCLNCESAVSLSYHLDITFTQAFTVYLPLVQRSMSPCTVAPTLISPTNGSALDTLVPLLVYMRGTDPVSYTTITIADNPAFDAPIQYSSSGGGIGPHQLRLFYNLEPATTYYWRVQDVCGSVYSPYSPSFSFITGSGGIILPAPTLISPADDTVGIEQEATLTWDTVGGAVGYELFRCREGGGCWLYFTSSTSQVIRYLDPNTTYEWYVDAYNDYAYGNQSDVWQFTTGSFTSLQEDVTSLQLEVPYTLYHPAERPSYVTEHRR
jgi:hypothetical protein